MKFDSLKKVFARSSNPQVRSSLGLAGLNATAASIGISVLFTSAASLAAPVIALVGLVAAACSAGTVVCLRDAFRSSTLRRPDARKVPPAVSPAPAPA